MSRWSEAFKALSSNDTADTADTNPRSEGRRVFVSAESAVSQGNGNQNVGGESMSIDSAPYVDDPIERAAIEAEDKPARRVRKRPVSWARSDDEPAPGDFCGCCAGLLWWSNTDPPRGWCCCTCHPPAHLQPGQFRVVAA